MYDKYKDSNEPSDNVYVCVCIPSSSLSVPVCRAAPVVMLITIRELGCGSD